MSTKFGTVRGLVRLLLSYGQAGLLLGRGQPDPASVARLVFVCQGNICRSAYAELAAHAHGLACISVGLSTEAGMAAHPPAVAAAAVLGRDMSAHRTMRIQDYDPQPGDLLLAMEPRQLARLAADPRLRGVPRSLLGLWARPPVPHLHDPYGLDDAYMLTCLRRIDGAVANLATAFPTTAACSSPSSGPPAAGADRRG